jgi:pimeloyl-ACP methyl ester carboxylesterase
MNAWIIDLKRKTRQEIIATGKERDPSWADEEFGAWADSKLRFSFNVLNGGGEIDWPATLRQITCPALLIKADEQRGGIITEQSAASLKALVPQVQVAHVAGAGHSIRRDQFEAYTQVVTTFLKSL